MPPPGRPSWPSRAASAIAIQNGCSPWSARCMAQVMEISVRRPSISRARATMALAETPVIAAAHVGVLRLRRRSRPGHRRSARRRRHSSGPERPVSCLPSVISTCASASISATSVLGRGASQSAPNASSLWDKHRADRDRLHAAFDTRRKPGVVDMGAGAAGIDHGVLERQAAEGDQELRVLLHGRPVITGRQHAAAQDTRVTMTSAAAEL